MQATPADLGMPFEDTVVPVDALDLPAWFIPARDGAPGPGVVLVHGWESGRDRTLPMAHFLNAAGFHCLLFDVRGHGANEPELLPVSGGEFGRDTLAAVDVLLGRPEVTAAAVSGHSMGAIGAILAGAADPRIAAVVAPSKVVAVALNTSLFRDDDEARALVEAVAAETGLPTDDPYRFGADRLWRDIHEAVDALPWVDGR